jgi:hypothetical protein
MDSPWASRTPRIGAKLGRLLGVFWFYGYSWRFFCCFLEFMDSVAMAPETAILAQIFGFFLDFMECSYSPKTWYGYATR